MFFDGVYLDPRFISMAQIIDNVPVHDRSLIRSAP